jgi:hypothetical protein
MFPCFRTPSRLSVKVRWAVIYNFPSHSFQTFPDGAYRTQRSDHCTAQALAPAIVDSRQGLHLGNSLTSPLASKTVLRMSLCQDAIGSPCAAFSTLSHLLSLKITFNSTSSAFLSSSYTHQAANHKSGRPRQEIRAHSSEG